MDTVEVIQTGHFLNFKKISIFTKVMHIDTSVALYGMTSRDTQNTTK